MATPFIGEIRLVAFTFPPKGWAFCNGQLLSINQYQALFSILGTAYGGDGINNFALPNLQGRVPESYSSNVPIGTPAGEAAHTLTIAEMPSHTHSLNGVSNTGATNNPAGNYLATTDSTVGAVYGDPSNPSINMAGAAVSNTGTGTPHPNLMPYLTVGFAIALQGIYPSRN